MLQLFAGPEVISIYADASYSEEVRVGCWAYTLPTFAIMKSGIEPGCSNNRLEFAAVVQGLSTATALDHTPRPIHVNTDSDYVIALMENVAKRVTLPDRKSYRVIRDLYTQACDLTFERTVMTSRRRLGDPHHTACDRKAKQELRRYCSDGNIARVIFHKRAYTKRKTILNEIRTAEQLLNTLENKLLECEIEIAALEYVPDPGRSARATNDA